MISSRQARPMRSTIRTLPTLLLFFSLFTIIFLPTAFSATIEPELNSAIYTPQPGPAEATFYTYFHGGFSCPTSGCTTKMIMSVKAVSDDKLNVPTGVMLVLYFYKGEKGVSNGFISAHNSVWKFTKNELEKKPFSNTETTFAIPGNQALYFFGQIVYYNSENIDIWKFDDFAFSFKFSQLANTLNDDTNTSLETQSDEQHVDFSVNLSSKVAASKIDENYQTSQNSDQTDDLSNFSAFVAKYARFDTTSPEFRSILNHFAQSSHRALFKPHQPPHPPSAPQLSPFSTPNVNTNQQNGFSLLAAQTWPVTPKLPYPIAYYNASFSGERYSVYVDAIRLLSDPTFPNASHHQLQIRFNHVRESFQRILLILVGRASFYDPSNGSGRRIDCSSDYGSEFSLRFINATAMSGTLNVRKDTTCVITCKELRIIPQSNYTQAIYLGLLIQNPNSAHLSSLENSDGGGEVGGDFDNAGYMQIDPQMNARVLEQSRNLSEEFKFIQLQHHINAILEEGGEETAQAATLTEKSDQIVMSPHSQSGQISLDKLTRLYTLYQQSQTSAQFTLQQTNAASTPRYGTFTPVTLSAQHNRRFDFGKQTSIEPLVFLSPLGYDWVRGYASTFTSSLFCRFQINFIPHSDKPITQQDISLAKEKFKITVINGTPLSPAYFTITNIDGLMLKHLHAKKAVQGTDSDPFLLYEPFTLYARPTQEMLPRYYLNAWIPLVNSTSEATARTMQCQIWYEQNSMDTRIYPETTLETAASIMMADASTSGTAAMDIRVEAMNVGILRDKMYENQFGADFRSDFDPSFSAAPWAQEYRDSVRSGFKHRDQEGKQTNSYTVHATGVNLSAFSPPYEDYDTNNAIPYPRYVPDENDLEDPIFASVLSNYLHTYHQSQPFSITDTNQPTSSPLAPLQMTSQNYHQFNTLSRLAAISNSKTVLGANSGTSIYNIMSYPDGRLFNFPSSISWSFDNYGIPKPDKTQAQSVETPLDVVDDYNEGESDNDSLTLNALQENRLDGNQQQHSSFAHSALSYINDALNEIKLSATILQDMISYQQAQNPSTSTHSPLSEIDNEYLTLPSLSNPDLTTTIPIKPFRTLYSSPYTIYINDRGDYFTRDLDYGSSQDSFSFSPFKTPQQPPQPPQPMTRTADNSQSTTSFTASSLGRPSSDKMESIFFLDPVASNSTYIYKAEFWFPKISRDFEQLSISFANTAYLFVVSDKNINYCYVDGAMRVYSNSTVYDETPTAVFRTLQFKSFTTYSQSTLFITCPGLYIWSQTLDTQRDDPHLETDYIFPEHHNALVIEGVARDFHREPHKYAQIVPFKHFSIIHKSNTIPILIGTAVGLAVLLIALIVIRCCFCRGQGRGIKRRGNKGQNSDDPNFFIRLDEQANTDLW